jgi:hypothetical protein
VIHINRTATSNATAGGDFIHCDGDQAFNIIKKLIAIYSLPSDFDSSLVSIFARLNTLETHTACLKECYDMLHDVTTQIFGK